MNKTYIRLLICSVGFLLIAALNSLYDFFNSYTLILFLLAFFIGVYSFIGYKKNRQRYKRDIIINLIIYSLSYYIIIYLIGLFIGFNKTGYSLQFFSIIKHIFPILLTIPLLELIRYVFITKGSTYKSIVILTVIGLVMMDITLLVNSHSDNIIQFVLAILVPSIAKNILLVYITQKVGYKPAVVYRLLFEIPVFILPIFPAFGIYITSLIQLLFPILLIYLLYQDFAKTKPEKVHSETEKRIIQKLITIITTSILIVIIFLTSGIGKHFAVTIGSNSMVPSINRGDILIIKRLNTEEIDDLEERDILVFKHGDIILVHRIIKIMEVNGEKHFYTKGDNNNDEDGYPIYISDVIGTTTIRLQYIGYLTVELNELINKK